MHVLIFSSCLGLQLGVVLRALFPTPFNSFILLKIGLRLGK